MKNAISRQNARTINCEIYLGLRMSPARVIIYGQDRSHHLQSDIGSSNTYCLHLKSRKRRNGIHNMSCTEELHFKDVYIIYKDNCIEISETCEYVGDVYIKRFKTAKQRTKMNDAEAWSIHFTAYRTELEKRQSERRKLLRCFEWMSWSRHKLYQYSSSCLYRRRTAHCISTCFAENLTP